MHVVFRILDRTLGRAPVLDFALLRSRRAVPRGRPARCPKARLRPSLLGRTPEWRARPGRAGCTPAPALSPRRCHGGPAAPSAGGLAAIQRCSGASNSGLSSSWKRHSIAIRLFSPGTILKVQRSIKQWTEQLMEECCDLSRVKETELEKGCKTRPHEKSQGRWRRRVGGAADDGESRANAGFVGMQP